MVTAWQYVAGAGLVGALCPLHGHVAVAEDGAGHGARVDVCVPAGQPRPPTVWLPAVTPPGVRAPARPSPRVTPPGKRRPTVHHPGQAPGLPARAEASGEGTQPPPVGAATGPQPEAAPAKASAPPPRRAAAPVTAFHVPTYHPSALERRGPNGMSTMMLMVVVTTPAVLAAAALRPRSKSAR
ncbi:hypothetical protein ABZ934_03160 [Streptomyces sp. NPDC046557]|uniref:hypothetical protein n=1 Tax=Streptomyces sp. NPDC046557 TaxID=3155372 RepID=UPI0033CFE2A0